MKVSERVELELIDEIGALSNDPYRFVRFAFPWREPGPLADEDGPDLWQRDMLMAVRDGLLTLQDAVRIAVASGHGVGKSALVSWLVLWAISTFEDTRGVVTANTENQLRIKTWAELSKWYRLLICRHWFHFSPTAIYARDPRHERTWRIDMVPWSAQNTEAFAGLHNAGKRILVVFDEASAIDTAIWETTEGALTDADTQIIWACFGNPTRNDGRFREAFGRFRHRWVTRQVDGRQVKITNKAQIQQWIDDYGEDSDFVRVRVRGVFPRAGSTQFIGSDVASEAAKREVAATLADPLIIGVDVARFGDDQSVIVFRKGRDARMIAPIKLRQIDTMQLASRVADEAARYKADAVFIDGGGVGGGVVDRCRQLRVQGLVEVQFGAKADRANYDVDAARYGNKRAEMWGNLRAWLAVGGIADDPELIADLTGIEYGYNADNALVLERKEDMKKRGLASPDVADALALTFAYPVQPSSLSGGPQMVSAPKRRNYDPHDAEGRAV